MRPRFQHEQTVTLTCSDNGNSNHADVLNFIPESKLVVSLNRSIKLEMRYNARTKMYTAKQSGLEFVSAGPATINVPGVNRR
jgi:hypothetical protein